MTSRSGNPVLRVAATSLASGVVTALLPPARLPVRVRRALHAALGLGAGAAVLVALSKPATSAGAVRSRGDALPGTPPVPDAEPSGEPLPVPARIAFATAFGGLMALVSVAGGVLDGRAEEALTRRGVSHPRLWMGGAAAALSMGSALAEKHPRWAATTSAPGRARP